MTRVDYRGPARGASILAQMLREEGLDVQYEPPEERRGVGIEALVYVTLYVGDKVLEATVGLSVDALVKKVVAKFKERTSGNPVEVEVEDDD